MKSKTERGSRDAHHATKNYLRQIYNSLEDESEERTTTAPARLANPNPGNDPEVDIVAVHGLDLLDNEEHGMSTWSEDGVIWLKDFLPKHNRAKRLRVLVFGYNSSAVFEASTAGVYGAAENLINQLSLVRKDCPTRPIIFVCHSLGGIVVKRAIVSAHTTDYYRSIYDSTKGVAFFATPHNGGNGVSIGDVFVKICRAVTGNARNDIMEALRRDSHIAGHIHRDFARRAQDLHILSFVETKPMSKPFLGIVVDQNSASLGWREPAEILVLLEETHRTICKYSQQNEAYERVSENMVDLISWAVESEPSSQIMAPTTTLRAASTPNLELYPPPPRYEERNTSDDRLTRHSSASTISYTSGNSEIHDKGAYLFPPSPFLGGSMSDSPRYYFDGDPGRSSPVSPWPVHMLPHIPPLKTKFVPRDDLFQSMMTALEGSGVLALYGLGGAGKSHLAARLAYWQVEHNPQVSVFWIHGGTANSVSEGLRTIARKLQVGMSVREENDRFMMVREWLEDSRRGAWILFVDGADDQAIFKRFENTDHTRQSSTKDQTFIDYIPRCKHGQVVFTTKTHSAATTYAPEEAILQVAALSVNDALQMLRTSLDDSTLLDDISEGTELVAALHCLPLAIAQAAGFMNRNDLTVTKYVEKIRDSSTFADLMTRPQTDSSNAVYTTWNLSFKKIQSERELAADVLAIMSFLEQETIPISILADIFGDTLALIEAVGDLKDYSLVSLCSKAGTLNMHRLVQVTTQHWLGDSGTMDKWAAKTLSALADHFPDASNRSSHSTCALYLPHALKLLQNPLFNQETDLILASLQHKIGRYYHFIGRWSEARPWTSAAYTIRTQKLGSSDASTLEAQEQLIRILRYLCDFSLAAREAQAFKNTLKSLHGRSHPSTLAAYRLVSIIFQDQGLFPASLAAAQKSFNGFKSLYSSSEPDNLDLLLSTARLGSIYTSIGEFAKAEELDIKVIKSFQRRNEEDSVDALKVLFKLSYIQRALGKYTESEKTARECHERQSRYLGAMDNETLKSYFSVGLSLQAQRNFKASLEVFEEIVRISSERVGMNHVYTCISTFHLAQGLAEVGRFEEAKRRFEEARHGFEQMDSKQDLEVARCREGTATVLRYDGSISEAETMYEQVLKSGKGQKGKEKELLDTLCWEGLAEIWKLRAFGLDGKETKICLKKALKFGQQALECRKKVYGLKHPEMRRTAELVIGILERLGEEGKVVRKLRSQHSVDGHQPLGSLGSIDKEKETGDLIDLG